MAIDPRLTEWLGKMGGQPALDFRTPAQELRRRFWVMARRLEADAPEMLEMRPLVIEGAGGPLHARLYVPHAAGVTGRGLIFYHGGGFVLGDLASHEMVCRRLADAARARVLAVTYRLAPEHKFPCAVEDAQAALDWALAHAAALGLDPARIGVGGDSAGGNLAAVMAQEAKRKGCPALAGQMLIYPSVQWVQMTPSQLRFREGYLLTQAAQDFFKDKYLSRREDAYDVRCSPLLENDLAGLPPAYVALAGFDPLYDEGKAYADKMAACGVPVTLKLYPDQIHGFFNMTLLSGAAKAAVEAAGRWFAAVTA